MTGFAENKATTYDAPMTKAAFLRWVQDQERRHELKDGRTIMQAGGTKRHNWICVNFVTVLRARLEPEIWAVGTADIAVEIGNDLRYPDVIVERLSDDGAALSTDRPVVLIEVLSPSSVGTDMSVKLAEYTSLPSLEAYIVASQDEPICWVWQRAGEERAFPSLPAEFKGRDVAIEIATPGVSIPLAEVYRRIGAG
jgi:Uma2 family endonuclease